MWLRRRRNKTRNVWNSWRLWVRGLYCCCYKHYQHWALYVLGSHSSHTARTFRKLLWGRDTFQRVYIHLVTQPIRRISHALSLFFVRDLLLTRAPTTTYHIFHVCRIAAAGILLHISVNNENVNSRCMFYRAKNSLLLPQPVVHGVQYRYFRVVRGHRYWCVQFI